MRYEITPMGAVRMNKSDAWRQRPEVLRYRAFKDEVRLRGVTLENGQKVTFFLPMPKSWSKKKRELMNYKDHTQKPDLDNCLKALMDAVFTDDAHISRLTIHKVWAVTGAIEIL